MKVYQDEKSLPEYTLGCFFSRFSWNGLLSFHAEINILLNWITSVSVFPDGKWIASGSWDDVRIWNAREALHFWEGLISALLGIL